jgi:type 1 fimbria pilin
MQSLRTHARPLVLALGTLLMLGAASTASASGVIMFAGELTAATCQVHGVDKPDNTGDFVVDLPTLSATQLDLVGVPAGHTRFGLQLKDCDASVNRVQAFFEGGPHLDQGSNTLIPNNGGPIHFALFNDAGGAIRVGDLGSQTAGRNYLPNDRMYFDVAYVRVIPGAITPGTFEAQVTYSLHYL